MHHFETIGVMLAAKIGNASELLAQKLAVSQQGIALLTLCSPSQHIFLVVLLTNSINKSHWETHCSLFSV